MESTHIDEHPSEIALTRPYLTTRLVAWRRRTETPLVAVGIGSLPILLLELKRDELPTSDQVFLTVVNVTVLVAFSVNYLVELALARKRAMYFRREWMGLLIVVAQVVALLPATAGAGVLRVLRAGRVLRPVAAGVRLVAVGGSVRDKGRSFMRRSAARLALYVAGLTWLCSAVAFAFAEGVGEGQRLGSFGDALWWSIATVTTVGYGDISPSTPLGKLVASFTMVIGIASFSVVTARVAQFLLINDETETDGS